jgi:hypothetical protein
LLLLDMEFFEYNASVTAANVMAQVLVVEVFDSL